MPPKSLTPEEIAKARREAWDTAFAKYRQAVERAEHELRNDLEIASFGRAWRGGFGWYRKGSFREDAA